MYILQIQASDVLSCLSVAAVCMNQEEVDMMQSTNTLDSNATMQAAIDQVVLVYSSTYTLQGLLTCQPACKL